MKTNPPHRAQGAARARALAAAAALCLAATGLVSAQDAGGAPERPWSFNASLSAYFVPDERDFVSPVVMADRKALHLEARYNYEALDTGSVWVGWNLHWGKALTLDLTPMVGGIVGKLDGVAPGYSVTLAYGKLALSSFGEYVFDASGREGNYFYAWSQLTYAPWDWLQVGLVSQRTRAYQTDLDVQRGFLVGFTYKDVNLVCNVFNPDRSPTVVLALGVTF